MLAALDAKTRFNGQILTNFICIRVFPPCTSLHKVLHADLQNPSSTSYCFPLLKSRKTKCQEESEKRCAKKNKWNKQRLLYKTKSFILLNPWDRHNSNVSLCFRSTVEKICENNAITSVFISVLSFYFSFLFHQNLLIFERFSFIFLRFF